MSKGENRVLWILNQAHIPYQREKSFTDLRRARYRFDFYLPSYNCLVEYDGEGHFYEIPGFKDFHAAQERDRRKNAFALAHSIPLYRIPFWKRDSLNCLDDIFQEEFRVKSKFHNDLIWKERCNNKK